MYPATFVTANTVLVHTVQATLLADAGCGAYDEPKTISAIQCFGCFFVDLSVDSQYLKR